MDVQVVSDCFPAEPFIESVFNVFFEWQFGQNVKFSLYSFCRFSEFDADSVQLSCFKFFWFISSSGIIILFTAPLLDFLLGTRCLWSCAYVAPCALRVFCLCILFLCLSLYIYIYTTIHICWHLHSLFFTWVFMTFLCSSVCFFVIIQGHGGMRPWKGAENTCRQPVQCFQVVVLDYILLGVDGFAPVEMLPESTQVLQVIRMISILDWGKMDAT